MSANIEQNNGSNSIQKQGIHPNSLANLKLGGWKPGQSGNPGGFPKGVPKLSHAYARLLALSDAELKHYKPKNRAERIALDQINDAIDRRLEARDRLASAKEIADRTEGRPSQSIAVTNQTAVEVERARFTAAIEGIIAETGCSWEQAVRAMVAINPENQQYLGEGDVIEAEASEVQE